MDLERFRLDYRALNKTFNPIDFDPAAWADVAASAGMKYVCFTTKHHDGFCMFDTRTTDYRITHPDCPFHADSRANVAAHVFQAFRERDLAISCYFSKPDWSSPHYWSPGAPAPDRNPNYDTVAEPGKWAEFVEFVHAQVRELMTGYGEIDVLWLDGGWVRPPQQDINMAAMAAMARELQPRLIVADRTVGGPYEDILTPEQEVPEAPLGRAWESCLTMGNGWAFRPDDEYKSTRRLLHLLIDIVAKGGNLLLNVGPSPQGTLPEEAVVRLHEMGEWMAINGEAIYGTRPISPYVDGNVRYTSRGDVVYAHILAPEGSAVPPAEVSLSIAPEVGSEVRLLGHAELLSWRADGDRALLRLPAGPLPCDHAWVVRYTR